ncbi:MAG: hypothetical protein TU35_008155 [Thermoproteus sp. AZ2]|uniref:Uncharacterized protein n=1 Tax=Thermoproteus sp. AZ2 TaxID=1609232 RepID=A0ACC6V2A4_9CREN
MLEETTGGFALFSALPMPAVFAFLVFMAMYSACIATLISMYRIVGLRPTALSAAVNLASAYAAAALTYAALSLIP